MMSKDKHRTIFSGQMEAFVFIILDMFFARCTVFKLGNITSFTWRILGHVMYLDQLCTIFDGLY